MKQLIHDIDNWIIATAHRISYYLLRFALFIIYFWFGLLKVLGQSPASPMVMELQHRTLPFIHGTWFNGAFGLFEVLIGILFLVPGAERIVIALMAFHMVTTSLPLFFLPHMVWTNWFVPTLEGQYIIKNIALITLAIILAARIKPWKEQKQ